MIDPDPATLVDRAALQQVGFVLLVPETLRPLVCEMFRPVAFGFGQVIVAEGEPPDALYVLTRGSARVLTERAGTEVTLGRLEPGMAFGEAALVAGGPRTATVRASEPVTALRLGRDAFDAVVALHPSIGDALAEHVRLQAVNRVLRTDPVFSLLPTEVVAETVERFAFVELAEGEVLVEAGGADDDVFIIESGRFVVSGPDGGTVGFVRGGDVVGERAALEGRPRTATITASAPGRVLRFDGATLRRLVEASPRFAAGLATRGEARDRRGSAVPLDFVGDDVAAPLVEPSEAETSRAARPRGRRLRSRGFPVVRQFDEADCAVAALASVARFHGRSVATTFIRDAAGTDTEGTSLRGICRAAEAIGLAAEGVKVSRDRVEGLALPAIIHWDRQHWVVLYRVEGDEVVVGDPATGLRRLTRAELDQAWSGYAALLTPTAALAEAPEDTASLRWVLPFLRPHRPILVLAGLLALVTAALEVSIPLLVGDIVDQLGPGHPHPELWPLALVLAAVVAAAVGVTWGQRRLLAGVAVGFDRETLDFLTGRLLSLPMAYFAKRKVGDIERRLQSMSDVRRIVVQEGIAALAAAAVLVAVVVAMVVKAPLLGLVFVVVLPLYGLLMVLSERRVRPVLATMQEAYGRYSASQVDLLKGVETVKTLGAEPGAQRFMGREFANLNDRLASAYRAVAGFDAGVQAVNLGTYALFVVLGALAVSDGRISLGTYVAFIGLMLFVSGPLLTLMGIWDDVQATSVLLARLHDVLSHEPEQGVAQGLAAVPSLQGHLQLRGVSFGYQPGDAPILSGIDLEVEPGTTVAIVGRSGSGKSTLLRLLGGLLEPSEGSILVDAVDVATLRRRELRERIGFVLQTPYVFNATVAENIAFGHDEIDLEQVQRAAEAADLHEIIERMPLGYETRVGDGAVRLSGGEAQRLSIARALYRQPPVLLLDEATSALDAEAEQALQRSLHRLSAGRTVIVVTHRLRSIRDADRIAVVERGHLVEEGTHDQLMAADGVYAYLYRLQYSDDGV